MRYSAKKVVERTIVWTFALICLFVLAGVAFIAADAVTREGYDGWGIEAALGTFTVALFLSPVLVVALLLRRFIAKPTPNRNEKV